MRKSPLYLTINLHINGGDVSLTALHSAAADKGGALDQFKTKIVLSSEGKNMWLGPILITFSCKIDVNYFPFDEQVSHPLGKTNVLVC